MKKIILPCLILFLFNNLIAQDTLHSNKYIFTIGLEKLNIANKNVNFEYARPHTLKNNSYGLNFSVFKKLKFLNIGLRNELLLLNTKAYYKDDFTNVTDTTALKIFPNEFNQTFKSVYYNLSFIIGKSLLKRESFSFGIYLLPGLSLPVYYKTDINANYIIGGNKKFNYESNFNDYYQLNKPFIRNFQSYFYLSSEIDFLYHLNSSSSIGIRFGLKSFKEDYAHIRHWRNFDDEYIWFLGKYYNLGITYVKVF